MNEQEMFWSGDFGNDYAKRNGDKQLLASNLRMWSRILEKTHGVRWVTELGANIGLNLQAISLLLPDARFTAVEINKKAAEILSEAPFIRAALVNSVYAMSISDFIKQWRADLSSEQEHMVICSGVLIHQNPDDLHEIYKFLGESSSKYVLINEYYNPTPTAIQYRGHSDKLFKRDFAGEFMEVAPEFKLIDYGFTYHKDNNFPKDDTTWFLMEKK